MFYYRPRIVFALLACLSPVLASDIFDHTLEANKVKIRIWRSAADAKGIIMSDECGHASLQTSQFYISPIPS